MTSSQQRLAQFTTTVREMHRPASDVTDNTRKSFHRRDVSVASSSVALPTDATAASPASRAPSQHGTDATGTVPVPLQLPLPLPPACFPRNASRASESESSSSGDEAAAPLPPTMQQCLSALDQVDTGLRYGMSAPSLAASKAHPTPFHSSEVPAVLLSDFGRLLCCHTGYGSAGLSVGLALMLRYIDSVDTAEGNKEQPALPSQRQQQQQQQPALCALTAHRLLLTCVVVGAKANFDHFLRNLVVARIVGLELLELNHLETTLLDALGFCAMPTPREVAAAPAALVVAHRAVSDDSSAAASDSDDDMSL